MKLSNLIENIGEKQVFGEQDVTIDEVITDSGKAYAGSLFVAIPGFTSDGHLFIDDAYARGCRAFITEKKLEIPGSCSVVVPNSRQALALICSAFYGNPSRYLNLIGITGTNGKTTTAFLLETILKEAGFNVGIISTVVYRFGSEIRQPAHTTPDPVELQKTLQEMQQAQVQYVVMEVSSHAIDQKRLEGCKFAAGVFTNLSPEHLDYHITMDSYFKTKQRFFTEILPCSGEKTVAAINVDDPKGKMILNAISYPALEYGFKKGDLTVNTYELSLDGIRAELSYRNEETIIISSKLTGVFNLYNIIASVATAKALGISSSVIKSGIGKAKSPPGRMEKIENLKGVLIFIDYAHTPDALENVLKNLIDCGAKKIITVFGCGGDRDKTKRPVMGNIAATYSSVVIITSDNPRTEDPAKIISEIETGLLSQGFQKTQYKLNADYMEKVYFVIPDRKTAIKKALNTASKGDVVLIAGKGHETYQEIKKNKIPFDDREEARKAVLAA